MKTCLKYLFLTLPMICAAVVLCVIYVDKSVALAVHGFFTGGEVKSNANIGNYLTYCAYLIMLPVFAGYYLFRLKGFSSAYFMRFLRQLSLSVVFAFFIKDTLKFFFGRSNALNYSTGKLAFLLDADKYGFHFMTFGEDSFPSGHMTILCAGMMSIMLFFPKLRIPAVISILLMATALLLNNFHFLSDIIAGTYLGISVALGIYYLETLKNKQHSNEK